MLLIHSNTMYNADVSIEEKNGIYHLVDSEQAVLFSSEKIANVNKALQYVTAQDAMGNGVLVDQIAANVYPVSIIFNSDVYDNQRDQIEKTLSDMGITPRFIAAELCGDTGLIKELEEKNEEAYNRDIEDRFAIGFTPGTEPEGYHAMEYSEINDYLGMNACLPELQMGNTSKETPLNTDFNTSITPNFDFDKEAKKKYIIETRDKTIETDTIRMSNKPSRKGFYYLNDDNGNGFFKSQNREVLATILEHIKDKQSAGEIIRVQELRKIERQLTSKNQDKSVEREFEDLQKSVKHIKELEKELEKEKAKANDQLDSLRKNNAPQEIVEKAESICKFADESVKRANDIPSNDDTKTIKKAAQQDAMENAYVTYRLHNTLLTRIHSALKAGVMKAHVNLMEPLRKLGDISMTAEVKALAKNNLRFQRKIEKYNQKLDHKMGKRLEKENRNRTKQGLRPLPSGTRLYKPAEQQKINEYQLVITANNRRSQLIQNEIIRTREEHKNRLDYIKGHVEIARNKKIVDRQKTAWAIKEPEKIEQNIQQNKESKDRPDKEPEKRLDKEPDVIPANETSIFPNDFVIPEPLPMPDDYPPIPPMEYEEMIPYFPEEPILPETSSEVFAPIKERFADAKRESEADKNERNARFAYHAINTKLPANGYIEFEVNGNSYSAQKNEFGEFTMKKYSYETGKNEEISADETIEEFKTDPKAFENAIREHLGGVLMNNRQNAKQDIDIAGNK